MNSSLGFSNGPIKLLLLACPDSKLQQKESLFSSDQLYQLCRVEELSTALNLLTREKFDAVVTELVLEDVQGLTIIEKILECNPGLPLIAIHKKDSELALNAIKAGAQDYLDLIGIEKEKLFHSIQYAIERKQVERGMGYLNRYDNLTGLPNRVLFKERLDHALSRAKRDELQVGILFIDLDRFKHINDTLGHEQGDAILIEVAKRLSVCTRQGDTVARLGGDKFMVLLESMKSSNDAAVVSNKIIDILAEPCLLDGTELYISPSIGIAVYPDDQEDAKELLKNAEAAVFRSKKKGCNRFQFYADGTNKESKKRLNLESKLRRALDNNEFVLHFQPKFDINTRLMTGAEALIRWNHPEEGMIPPLDFIPLAEETGLIVPIGKWVIEEACQNMYRWKMDGFSPLRIAVNLSPIQFHQSEFIEHIQGRLQEYEINPREFEVEITEGILMEDTEATIGILNALKSWGLHISVDDFGTGYCSLGYLKKFPIDTLKIDRAFVKDITTRPDDAAIAQAIIALGRTLRINVTAEGIETADQLQFLRQSACDEGQGYFYSKPLSVEELTRFMERHNNVLPLKKPA